MIKTTVFIALNDFPKMMGLKTLTSLTTNFSDTLTPIYYKNRSFEASKPKTLTD